MHENNLVNIVMVKMEEWWDQTPHTHLFTDALEQTFNAIVKFQSTIS